MSSIINMKADENGALLLTPDILNNFARLALLKSLSHIELFCTLRCHLLTQGRGHENSGFSAARISRETIVSMD